jgi:hypothetical protein
MTRGPFTSAATDDLELACAIERDAELLDSDATLDRYLPAIGDPRRFPMAFDAAIESVIRADCARDGVSALEAARRIAARHTEHTDAILAVALGFGLADDEADPLAVGNLLFGRWRVLEVLGRGATAQVARARDELLSTGTEPLEVAIKRFDDGAGGDARVHAIREMSALARAPAGIAPQLVALHAPRSGAACIVTRFEPSREARIPEDLDAGVEAIRRLHKAGIAHGDLKAEHIRVRPDGSVLLLDFGSASSATSDACHDDLMRIAEVAATHAHRGSARWCAFAARRALRRRQPKLASMLLRAAAPLRRRRLLARGAAMAVALAALLFTVLPQGDALTAQSNGISALAASGRLIDATLDSKGRLVEMRLSLPELTDLYPDSRGQPILMRSVRFGSDGHVTFVDVDGKVVSR